MSEVPVLVAAKYVETPVSVIGGAARPGIGMLGCAHRSFLNHAGRWPRSPGGSCTL